MPIKTRLTTKGFEEYLEAIQAAQRDIDAAADEALQAGGGVLLGGMQERVPVGKAPEDPHPGNLKRNLALSEPQSDGGFHFVEVGLLKGTDADTARYGGVQEFGSAHTPAQPYIRPTLDTMMGKARAAMKEVLERWKLI